MKDKYMLEIYYPSGATSAKVYFTSDLPFQAISTGDIISTSELPDANKALDLRVTSIEHILWTQDGESKHKVCVYTEGFDGSSRM